MLRQDAIAVFLGVVVATSGLSALALFLFRRKRGDLTLVSFSMFAFLYGVRLLIGAPARHPFPGMPSKTLKTSQI